jgi:cytidylate kinase
VTQFQVAADGVATVDSSDLDFEQTVDALLAVVTQVTGREVAPSAGSGGTGRA